MSISDFTQSFLANITLEEFIAAAFGVISVWYSRKNNIFVYPTGIISVLLYVYICYKAGLYADAGLNFYYFIMSVIGWYNWTWKKDDTPVFPISSSTRGEWWMGIGIFIFLEISVYWILSTWTDSTVPVLDSIVSSSAGLAMWWMARRKLESWYAWTLSNIIAIPLFFYKELYFTVIQYLVFLVLAIWGYFTWKKIIKQEADSHLVS